jgi:hypothetical protein
MYETAAKALNVGTEAQKLEACVIFDGLCDQRWKARNRVRKLYERKWKCLKH